MSDKEDHDFIKFNEEREKRRLPAVSRRGFVKLAATSAGVLTLPMLAGFVKPACKVNCDSYLKRTLVDPRANVEVDPSIELDDYSGPFRSDLRHSYFSRKQLAWMLIMAHHYHYDIQKAYRAYIEDSYGTNGVLKTEKSIWGSTMSKGVHDYYSETMNIKGKDIEAFMKHWQIDLNSLPGDNYDVIFEMPAKNRGLVTFNRCPLVAQYEEEGRADELTDLCNNRCVYAIEKNARRYNDNIRLNVLAMPPRQSDDHICCKFELYYRGGKASPKENNLAINYAKADKRGERVVDWSIELQDYSGPFRPNLRFTDFSRKQLARMFLMQHQYDLDMMQAYETWVLTKTFDMSKRAEISVSVWSNELYVNARNIMMKYMNTSGVGIDSFLKAIQVDVTSQPPNFDQTFEMPSEDLGYMTYNKCKAVTQMELLGIDKLYLADICAMDPAAIGKSTVLYHPQMRVNVLKLPPRKYTDEVCCKWEFSYE